jgi:hypothetical protein
MDRGNDSPSMVGNLSKNRDDKQSCTGIETGRWLRKMQKASVNKSREIAIHATGLCQLKTYLIKKND